MKPQCRSCDYLEVNPHSDEWFCMHDDANEAQIIFYYIQQRRPVWCPLTKKKYEPPKDDSCEKKNI